MTQTWSIAIALGALACAPAFAQNTSTWYGAIDTGYEYLNHVGTGDRTVTRMPVIGGADLPSRWGLKGEEALGAGQAAVFALESGFALATGMSQQGNRLFGRQAYVGFKGAWGQLTLGRQYSMTSTGMAESNVFGAGGFGGLASFDPYLLAARFDNDIVYLGSFSGLTVGASYSPGRDSTSCAGEGASGVACRALSAMLKYGNKAWGVAATYEEQRGGPGGAAATVLPGVRGIALTAPGDKDVRYQLAAYGRVAAVQLGAGWLRRHLHGGTQAAATDIQYLGASLPLGRWTLDAEASHIGNRANDADATMLALRTNYNLSRRTALYGALARVRNSGAHAIYSVSAATSVPAAPAPGVGQSGVEIGMRQFF